MSLRWGAGTFYLDLMGSEKFGNILDKELKQSLCILWVCVGKINLLFTVSMRTGESWSWRQIYGQKIMITACDVSNGTW